MNLENFMALPQIRFCKKFLGILFFGDAVDTCIHEETKNKITTKFEVKGRICDSAFIANLADKGAKKSLPSPASTVIFCLIFLSLYAIILLQVFGVRSDIFTALLNFDFQIEIFLNIILILVSIASVAFLRLPSLGEKSRIGVTIITFFILLFLAVCFDYCSQENHAPCPSESYKCLLGILLFSLVPLLFLTAILRFGVMTNYLTSFIAIGVASGSFAYLIERLINSAEEKIHLILWHFAPIFLVILLSSFLIKKTVKKL